MLTTIIIFSFLFITMALVLFLLIKTLIDVEHGKYFYTYKIWSDIDNSYILRSSYSFQAKTDTKAIKKAKRKIVLDGFGCPGTYELICVCKKVSENKNITIWNNTLPNF